jgi:hypothetical protein
VLSHIFSPFCSSSYFAMFLDTEVRRYFATYIIVGIPLMKQFNQSKTDSRRCIFQHIIKFFTNDTSDFCSKGWDCMLFRNFSNYLLQYMVSHPITQHSSIHISVIYPVLAFQSAPSSYYQQVLQTILHSTYRTACSCDW